MDMGARLDYGCYLTGRAVQRQIEAMPCALYLVRLIHQVTGRACPGQRVWTSAQLLQPATLRFLRLRNREGHDVFFRPFAGTHNAGYILVDLDAAPPAVVAAMRRAGHEPCVVLRSSPGHQQVWIRISTAPLEPALATAIAGRLAGWYRGDRASADAMHLGRLAGFTNQKPPRRLRNGYAPWAELQYAQPVCASRGGPLVERARAWIPPPSVMPERTDICPPPTDSIPAAQLYQAWLDRLLIPQRFPQPDWSVADKWIAKEMLRRGLPPASVAGILAAGSPGFPRRHADPADYLRRTLARALQELVRAGFSPLPAPCVDPHARTSS